MPTRRTTGSKRTSTIKLGKKAKGPEERPSDAGKGRLKPGAAVKALVDDCPTGQELAPQTQLNREITSFNLRHDAAVLEYNR